MSESAAAWFRRARLRAGYRSQAELARALGLARAAVGNWESETVAGRPSRAILPRLAHLLGVSPDELAARFGIESDIVFAEVSSPGFMGPGDDLLAAIEEAVARGVARGIREALGERRALGDHGEAPAGDEGGAAAGRTREPG